MNLVDSLKELIWPEGVGVVGAIAGHYLSRGIDTSQEWTRAFRRTQDYVAIGLGGVGAFMNTQAGATKEIGRGLFQGDLALIGEGIADAIFKTPEERFGGLRSRRKIEGNREEGPPPSGEISPAQVSSESTLEI